MKPARLDQILLQLGFITDDQIAAALQRQRDRGGRFGSHLVELRSITNEQLTQALSTQHGVNGFNPEVHTIDMTALDGLPADHLRELQLIPLRVDSRKDTLYVVIADPDNTDAIMSIREYFKSSRIEMLIAPETVIAELIDSCFGAGGTGDIALPELFEPEAKPAETPVAEHRDLSGAHTDVPVLMVSRAAALKNFLGAIFQRDGFELHVHSEPEELQKAVQDVDFQHVLVAEDMYDDFVTWSTEGRLANLHVPFDTFTSVSRALLDNPVPYQRTVGSLLRTLHIIAGARTSRAEWKPPYVLICKDIRGLSERYGLGRVAMDGLQLAAYLLLPASDPAAGALPVTDFARTVDYARTIRFPWHVDEALELFESFHNGSAEPDSLDTASELNCGSQILALAWYRHVVLRASRIRGEEGRAKFKSALRNLGGRVAALELIEGYISMIEEKGDSIDSGQQILIVAKTNEWMRQFSTRFSRTGIRTVWTDDLVDAERLCLRQTPTAVVIDYDDYSEIMGEFCLTVKTSPQVLLYAIASSVDPSLILDLLDAGVDDVIAAPHDYDIIAARIERAIRGLSDRKDPRSGGFDASFEVFSFVDLIQSLAHSQKSVRVELAGGDGEQAVVHMYEGRIVHATSGEMTGEQAVYQVISWEDNGTFSVIRADEFPEPNVSETNEGMLMEGCRLLDESRV